MSEKKSWKIKHPKDSKLPNWPKPNWWKSALALFLVSLLIAVFVIQFLNGENFKDNEISLNEFEQRLELWLYGDILIDGNKVFAEIRPANQRPELWTWTLDIDIPATQTNNSRTYQNRDLVILPVNDSLTELGILDNLPIGTTVNVKDNTSDAFWGALLPTLIGFILFFWIALFLISRMGGVANNAMTFWKSRAKLYDKEKDKITFQDVAGADEEKEELFELVDFLKNPRKYKLMGAKIPKWVLLVGPPGTWKTLLARAVAGESWVPFLSISGSEFVEMFVWVGASRVRDLFENAKKMAPAIIFIDEIDAIGKKRWPGLGGWHDEREQTLNQILTEMDWFDNETNIIVIGATNRSDVLDKALLRPGRFDRKITVNLPNLNDREKILEVHAKGKTINKDVDFHSLASSTVGFSWADLWNLVNEAAIISARNNEKNISSARFQEAFERIVMGLRKKSFVMNDIEKKITAYHEVGHAIVWNLLPNSDPVHKVSIVSRGGALWVTWFLPERDAVLVSKAKFLDELAVLFGGRAAEEIFFGKENITTWASNDIERATKIARGMVMKYGMYEEIGTENFAWEAVSWNHLWAETDGARYSWETAKAIDQKVKDILRSAYDTALRLIQENKDLHIRMSEDLIKKEEIDKEEFNAYFA